MNNNKTNAQNSSLVNKAIYLVIFALLFIFPAFSQMTKVLNSSEQVMGSVRYSITQFNVGIELSEQNVAQVTEKITVNPETSMRGITRAIPIYQTAHFEQNNKKHSLNYKAKITDISVNDYYDVYEENGFKLIEIGGNNSFSGQKTYIINYLYDMGPDRINEFDQFYFNIIGADWDAKISNISFNITMPKSLAQGSQMFMYSGEYGSSENETVVPSQDNITFSHNYIGTLNEFEALTVRTVMQEGYFDFSAYENLKNIIAIVGLVIIAVFTIIFAIAITKIKKQIITPVVMFSAPRDLPPSELGYIIDGVVDNQDIVSLIVYWADKGYLNIKEENKKYTLIKNKEMEEKEFSGYQKNLFNAIFAVGQEAPLDSIGERIFINVEQTKQAVKAKHINNNFNVRNINLKTFFVFLATTLVTGIATYMTSLSVSPVKQFLASLFGLVALGMSLLFMNRDSLKFKNSNSKNNSKHFVHTLIVSVCWIITSIMVFDSFANSMLINFLVLIPAFILLYYAFALPIRQDAGLEVLGEILGFKQFIEFTEKDRIKMLASEDPEMFYSVLPYAYVLGVSDQWINKFEGIALTVPSWYQSATQFDVFDYMVMRSILNSMMLSTMKQMSYVPTNNNSSGVSGGGFGGMGGGFSGGGFGGGGGRGR